MVWVGDSFESDQVGMLSSSWSGCVGSTFSWVCGEHVCLGVWGARLSGCVGSTFVWVCGEHVCLGVWGACLPVCVGSRHVKENSSE